MGDATWSSQLAEAILTLTDSSKIVAYPSRCADALAAGVKQGLSGDAKSNLWQMLEPLRAWRAFPGPDFSEALSQRLQLHAHRPIHQGNPPGTLSGEFTRKLPSDRHRAPAFQSSATWTSP